MSEASISAEPYLQTETNKSTKLSMETPRPLSRHSEPRRSPSVASEHDYKEWFDRFDNHITPNLTVTVLEEHFDSEDEEAFVSMSYENCTNDLTMNEIADACDKESGDVSVSITINLKVAKDDESSKIADHQSSHISAFGSESDSDVPCKK